MRLTYKQACEVLSIDLSATEQQVKEAYKRLALQYHPDRNTASDATHNFQRVQAAFERLTSASGIRVDSFGDESDTDGDYDDDFGDGFFDFQSELAFLSFLFSISGFTSRKTFFSRQAGGFGRPFGNMFGGGGSPRFQHLRQRLLQDQLEAELEEERRRAVEIAAQERARKAEESRRAEAERIQQHLRAAQKARSAAFLAARSKDSSDFVKKKVYEENVPTSEGELLSGLSEDIQRKIRVDVALERDERVRQPGQQRTAKNEGVEKENIGAKGKAFKKKKRTKAQAQRTRVPFAPSGLVPNVSIESHPANNLAALDKKETLLHIAAKNKDVELVAWLLNHGASAEERDSQGYSAYHWAVVQGDLETVLTFEDLFGADLSQRFASPAPPSDSLASLAVMSGSWEMVEHVPCTSQEAQECLEWIDTMLAAPLARPDEHDRTQFSEIKLVLQACLSHRPASATDEPAFTNEAGWPSDEVFEEAVATSAW